MPRKKNRRTQQEAKCTSTSTKNNNEDKDDDVPEHLICPVCMEVPEKVMITDDCGHLLCESCTNELLKNETVKCPVCNMAFTKSTIRHSLFLQRQINALPIECPSECCDWKKERSELPAHLNRCPFATIPCPSGGCKATMKRQDLAAHEAECPHATVECPNKEAGCKEHMKRFAVSNHRFVCEYEMIMCPNGCDAKMLLKDVEAHEDECPEAVVRCPHAEDGCKARIKRKNLEEHTEANKFEHLQLQVVALKAENAKMKDDHTKQIGAMREENTAIKDQIGAVMAENEALKNQNYSVGERCIVKLPVNDDGSSTCSKDFTLFGEQWKLTSSKQDSHRSVYLKILSSSKYDAPFSLAVLSPTNGSKIYRKASKIRFGTSWGWKSFIPEQTYRSYVQHGCFYVEVWLLEVPSTQL